MTDLRASYDRVADEYVRRISDELTNKPFDRQVLDAFAARMSNAGLVCDLGCGPGHVGRYLHDRGVRICGVDLSSEMVERARRLNPDIVFDQGDMLKLDVPDGIWAGIVAFYSIIHIPRNEVVAALLEMKRALRPGGTLLLAFHLGDEVMHRDEWWGYEVNFDVVFFRTAEMRDYLKTAGFSVEQAIERDPYPDIEYPSRRAYIQAVTPSQPRTAGARRS